MPKYEPSDEGKTIGGAIVTFLHPASAEVPGDKGPAEGKEYVEKAPKPAKPPKPLPRAAAAKAQAAALTKAAAHGVPFCEECEAARKKLAKTS